MLVLGTTNSAGLALVSVTLVSASGIGLSIHMGLLSSAVLSTDQGRLMAAVRLVSGTTGLIAPLAFPTVFARVIDVDAALAGLPFVAAAVLTGTAGAIAWTFWVKRPNSEIPDT